MRSSVRDGIRLSLEGRIDGKKTREIEYTFYGKLKDLSELSKAIHKEEHEQWNLNVDCDESEVNGRVRIRAINGMRWILTTKLKHEGMLGWEEVECDISQDMFEHLREMSKTGYKKTRYNFKVPNSTHIWEIDVYKDSMGKDHPWVKIDLEVSGPQDPIPEWPVGLEEVITHQSQQLEPKEKTFIDSLWSELWAGLHSNQRL